MLVERAVLGREQKVAAKLQQRVLLERRRASVFQCWVEEVELAVRAREQAAEADAFRRFHSLLLVFSLWERRPYKSAAAMW